MTATLTRGPLTLTVLEAIEVDSDISAGSVVHDLIGGGIAAVVLGHHARRVTLTWLCATDANARAVELLLAAGEPVTHTYLTVPSLNMTGVAVGSISRVKASTRLWSVTATLAEVTP